MRPSLTRASRPIAVVDERTYRHANRCVDVLLETGDLVHALSVLTSMRIWLRYEITTGSRRKAAARAARLEQVEMRQDEIRAAIGFTAA